MPLQDSSTLESELQSAIHLLKIGDFQARWEAAKTLPRFGTIAIDPLIDLLQEAETDWELLWFVARILGSLQHPDAVNALAHLCATTHHIEVAEMAATALAQQGTGAIEPLVHLLEQQETRLLAVQTLAQIRHPDVIAPLTQAANDVNPAVRAAAIESLGSFYGSAVSQILLKGLSDLHPAVRKASVIGLGLQAEQWAQPDLVVHLAPYLRDFSLEVCNQTAISLSRLGSDAAIDALAEVLHAPHTPLPLQVEIVRALSWIGTVRALAPLRYQLHQIEPEILNSASPTLHHEIFAALGRIEVDEAKPYAAAILLEQLQSHSSIDLDLRSKQIIVLSLGQLGQLEAIAPLIQQLADPNTSVRLHIVAALKQLSTEIAYAQLRQVREQPSLDPNLCQGIEMALREW